MAGEHNNKQVNNEHVKEAQSNMLKRCNNYLLPLQDG